MQTEIKTKRMSLRLIKEEDLEQIAELNIDRDVRKFFLDGVLSRKQTKKMIKEYIYLYEKHGLPHFIILNKKSWELIGRCGFTPLDTGQIEVSFIIAKRFWGMGYATEALNALLKWGRKNMDVTRIIGFAPLEHKASHHVMEKCNMEYYINGIEQGVKCKFYRMKTKSK